MPQAPLKKKQTAKPQRNRLAGITKSQGGGLKKGAKVIAPKNVARLKVHKFSKVGFSPPAVLLGGLARRTLPGVYGWIVGADGRGRKLRAG